MEPVDSGYADSSVAAHKNDVVCNGNVLPKAVKDIDALQRDGQSKVCDSLTLNIVAVDNDVFVDEAKLVVSSSNPVISPSL